MPRSREAIRALLADATTAASEEESAVAEAFVLAARAIVLAIQDLEDTLVERT